MDAKLLFRERIAVAETAFVDIVLWLLPAPLPGSSHRYKYRLVLVVDGACVLRYDNESGKGDHRHAGNDESIYRFSSPGVLFQDFWRDVDNWRA